MLETPGLISLIKPNIFFSQKFLNDICVHALSQVQERIIGNFYHIIIYENLFVDQVESEVQMFRRKLHSINCGLIIKQWSSALSPQSRCAEFYSGNSVVFRQKTG